MLTWMRSPAPCFSGPTYTTVPVRGRDPQARILGRCPIWITKKVGDEGRENENWDGKQAGRRVKREDEPDRGENADVQKTLLRDSHVNRKWRKWLVGSSP